MANFKDRRRKTENENKGKTRKYQSTEESKIIIFN
jgi:hypothetical protein